MFYFVIRDKGWPAGAEIYKFDEIVELTVDAASAAVDAGHLLLATAENITADQAKKLVAWRATQPAAAQKAAEVLAAPPEDEAAKKKTAEEKAEAERRRVAEVERILASGEPKRAKTPAPVPQPDPAP